MGKVDFISINSVPSESYLRRHERHDDVQSEFRIQCFRVSAGRMTVSRLLTSGRNVYCISARLGIGLLFGEDMPGCFRKMPGDRPYCYRMSFSSANSIIEGCCMSKFHSVSTFHDCRRCFTESPFQVSVAVGWRSPVSILST